MVNKSHERYKYHITRMFNSKHSMAVVSIFVIGNGSNWAIGKWILIYHYQGELKLCFEVKNGMSFQTMN